MSREIIRWTRLTTRGALGIIVVSTAAIAVRTVDSDARGTRGGASVPARFARLVDIPSHNERYRASLTPAAFRPELGRSTTWTLSVTTATGTPVEHASLSFVSWMPDANITGPRPRVTRELGGGRYQVDGLRFDRAGWWNVRLRISSAVTIDSLAFNLVF